MRNVIHQWLQLVQMPILITDEKSGSCQNTNDFKDHRHDQVLLSTVICNNKLNLSGLKTSVCYHHHCTDETQFAELLAKIL